MTKEHQDFIVDYVKNAEFTPEQKSAFVQIVLSSTDENRDKVVNILREDPSQGPKLADNLLAKQEIVANADSEAANALLEEELATLQAMEA